MTVTHNSSNFIAFRGGYEAPSRMTTCSPFERKVSGCSKQRYFHTISLTRLRLLVNFNIVSVAMRSSKWNTHMRAHARTHTHIIHTRAHAHARNQARTHANKQTQTHICTRAHIHPQTHTCGRAHIRESTRTQILLTHTPAPALTHANKRKHTHTHTYPHT